MRRRDFIVTSTASIAAAIGLAYVALPSDIVDHNRNSLKFLSARDQLILAALLPVLLAGYVNQNNAFPIALENKILSTVDQAIDLQLPRVQAELRQLFDVLEVNLTRVLLTQQLANWNQLSWQAKQQMLQQWRDSVFELLQTAYSGMHDLVLAAYFVDSESWPQIGYEPPPSLRGS